MRPVNERWCYIVMSSLIGWAHTQNDPWVWEAFHFDSHKAAHCMTQGVVSLTFCELSKIFSRNLCIAEIVLLMKISNWNFVRVPNAMLWAHIQSFILKFSPQMWFLALLCIFTRLFWRARETLLILPPGLSERHFFRPHYTFVWRRICMYMYERGLATEVSFSVKPA